MGAVAVRPKVGAENGSSNSPFAYKAAVFLRSCAVLHNRLLIVKRIAQRAGETVKTEHSMAVPLPSKLPAARNCKLDTCICLRPQIEQS
jgi:hypothetical protein